MQHFCLICKQKISAFPPERMRRAHFPKTAADPLINESAFEKALSFLRGFPAKCQQRGEDELRRAG